MTRAERQACPRVSHEVIFSNGNTQYGHILYGDSAERTYKDALATSKEMIKPHLGKEGLVKWEIRDKKNSQNPGKVIASGS